MVDICGRKGEMHSLYCRDGDTILLGELPSRNPQYATSSRWDAIPKDSYYFSRKAGDGDGLSDTSNSIGVYVYFDTLTAAIKEFRLCFPQYREAADNAILDKNVIKEKK